MTMLAGLQREAQVTISVIVNADDFGLTEGVNRSIIACHQAGSVSSTTLMANMGAAAHAAQLAQENRGLGVGLHFNLTTGRPLSPPEQVCSLLRPDGSFLSRGQLILGALSGRLVAAHVVAELEAQLRRMRSWGLSPSHFDSHQHVHAIPLIFKALAEAARREGVPLRLPLQWPGRIKGKGFKRRLSEQALRWLLERSRRHLPQEVPVNDGLCSLFDLGISAESIAPTAYFRLLDAYDAGVIELMVHPAEVDAELASLTAITGVSACEDQLLRTAFLKDYLSSRGALLINYRDLAKQDGQ